MTQAPRSSHDGREIRASVFASGDAKQWIPTLVSLRAASSALRIVVGAPVQRTLDELERYADDVVVVASGPALIETIYDSDQPHVLVVVAPAAFPKDLLDRAILLVEDDLRCSSVSFLSNTGAIEALMATGSPSIPRGLAADPSSVTSGLRARAEGLEPASIPYPVGPAVLVSSQGLSLVRPFPGHGGRLALWMADYGASARARGMLDLLDPTTFVARPPEGSSADLILAPDEIEWMESHHRGIVTLGRRPEEAMSAFHEAVGVSISAMTGLRLILDGTCLMPMEMGHQVTFLAMVAALAARDDVAYLGIVLDGPAPPYAREVLTHPKIDARVSSLNTLDGFPEVDVVHRPFQVTPGVDPSRWRKKGRRIAVTIHDLIAFQIPGYHSSSDAWIEYRSTTRSSTSLVDGVMVISQDTGRQMVTERLGVDATRVFVVPNGVGHLTGNEKAVQPSTLLDRGFAGESFMLVLGTDYTHKNRDLAIETARELRSRGFDLALVMAGAHVLDGSSRAAEEATVRPDDRVIVIPDVSSEERNWLLRHASVVIYPTGAEGFGLVPHEAAAFGTPTVAVPIPALKEHMGDLPISPRDWSIGSLADACAALLSDPAVAAAQVRAINAGLPECGWDESAALLVDAFRSLLSRPPVATV